MMVSFPQNGHMFFARFEDEFKNVYIVKQMEGQAQHQIVENSQQCPPCPVLGFGGGLNFVQAPKKDGEHVFCFKPGDHFTRSLGVAVLRLDACLLWSQGSSPQPGHEAISLFMNITTSEWFYTSTGAI